MLSNSTLPRGGSLRGCCGILFRSTVFSTLFLLSLFSFGQSPPCGIPSGPIVGLDSHPGATGLGAQGIMFDVEAATDLLITTFYLSNTDEVVDIYKKISYGTHRTVMEDPAQWELVYSGFVNFDSQIFNNTSQYYSESGPLNVFIPAGEIQAFYVTEGQISNSSPSPTTVVNSDANMNIYGGTYFFSSFDNSGYGVNAFAHWAGSINYLPVVQGCTDNAACNYDPAANCDDGSCIVPVANCLACNATNDGLDFIDTDGDGVCDAFEVPGCTNVNACNYDFTADTDDGSCILGPSNDTCEGAIPLTLGVTTTVDNSGTCDDGPIPLCGGAQDIKDVWYTITLTNSPTFTVTTTLNGTNTDSRLALFDACNGTEVACNDDYTVGLASQIVFTGTCGSTYYLQASGFQGNIGSYDVLLTLEGSDSACDDPTACNYNPNPCTVDNSTCILPDGCTDPNDCNYDPTALCDDGSCTVSGGTTEFCLFDALDNCAPVQDLCSSGQYNGAPTSWSQNIGALIEEVVITFSWTGDCDGIGGATTMAISLNGVSLFTETNASCNCEPISTYTFDAAALTGQLATDNILEVSFDGDAQYGGIQAAVSYISAGGFGCNDPLACNYDPLAGCDDGSCIVPEANCSACNATNDGLDIIDTDGDGICDGNEIPGCTDTNACNYNAAATDDDNTCFFSPVNDTCEGAIALVEGVTTTVDNSGTCDDGPEPSCGGFQPIKDVWYTITLSGPSTLTVTTTLNGTSNDSRLALYDDCNGVEVACNDDFNGFASQIVYTSLCGGTYYLQASGYSNIVGSYDLVYTVVEEDPGSNCDDPSACNYNPNTCIVDNSTCILPDGCTNPLDCNYNPAAICDDGSCTYVAPGVTDFCLLNPGDNCSGPSDLCNIGGYEQFASAYSQNIGSGFVNIDVSLSWTSCFGTTMTISLNGTPLYTEFRNSCQCEPESTYSFDEVALAGAILPANNILEVSFDDELNYGGLRASVNYIGSGGVGCIDPSACNYDPTAICDNGSCAYTTDACGVCGGTATTAGCTDMEACNYDPAADCNDGSCSFPPTESTQYCLYEAYAGACSPVSPLCDFGFNELFDGLTLSQNIGVNIESVDVTFSYTSCLSTNFDILLNGSSIYTEFNSNCSCEGVRTLSFNATDLAGQLAVDNIIDVVWDGNILISGLQLNVTLLDALPGCTDPTACNYDAGANCDDGSCILPVADCSVCNATNDGLDIVDTDGDGICDADEVSGCSDLTAENYDPSATDNDGSCSYCSSVVDYDATLPDPIVIGSGLSNQHMAVADDCPIVVGLKAHYRFTGDIIPTGDTYRALTGESPTSGIDPTPDPGTATWNYLLSVNLGTLTFEEVNVYLDIDFDSTDGAGQVGPFVADVSQTMIDNGLGATSFVQDSQNLGFGFWQALGSPDILLFDPFANGVYDIAIRVVSPEGVELVNVPIRVVTFTEGCTDSAACNYDMNATDDDGSCIVPVADCTVCNATNDGLESVDTDGDGVCDADEISGCTDATACNYNMTATDDDGSCIESGCTYLDACNYNSAAGCDDGSCEYSTCVTTGCTYPDSPEYNAAATADDGSCTFPSVNDCPTDINGDGITNTGDLTALLGQFGVVCQ